MVPPPCLSAALGMSRSTCRPERPCTSTTTRPRPGCGAPAAAHRSMRRSGASDPMAERLRELGIRSMVASPITVEGRLWGVVNALSRQGPFPSDAPERMADFTELVATAIGNAESRAQLAASRTRIVAAAEAARGRIEWDLQDGAQQHP